MNRLHCIVGEEKHGGRTVHPVEPAPACLPPLNLYPLVKPHAEIARMWARARTNLLAEHDKLDRAIEALDGPKRRGRPPGPRTVAPAKRNRTLNAAGRKAIAEAARKRWAAIRAGNAPSPLRSGRSGGQHRPRPPIIRVW